MKLVKTYNRHSATREQSVAMFDVSTDAVCVSAHGMVFVPDLNRFFKKTTLLVSRPHSTYIYCVLCGLTPTGVCSLNKKRS